MLPPPCGCQKFVIILHHENTSGTCSFALIAGGYSTSTICCCFIVSRQNPVFVGYFFALLPEILSNGYNLVPNLKDGLVYVFESGSARLYDFFDLARGVVHVDKTLFSA